MARLTAKRRQGLPKSDFALPGKGEGPKGAGAGSYPIPDKRHAIDALSRASANATPTEQRTIRAAVHRKYPGIQMGDESNAESRTARRAMLYSHERSRRYQ